MIDRAPPEFIRVLIDAIGVSQATAAKMIGVSDRSMRKYCADGAPLAATFALKYFAEDVVERNERLQELGLPCPD